MAGEASRVVPLKAGGLPRSVEKAPHSVQAEQALIGAIMLNNRVYDELEGCLQSDHFYVPLYGEVFRAAEEIINHRGVEANPINIAERLKASQFNADKSLFPQLTQIFETASFSGDARSLANVILTTFRQRQLMGLAVSVHGEAVSATTPEKVEELLDAAGAELFRLAEVGGNSAVSYDLRVYMRGVLSDAMEARENGGGLTGISSGFVDLDKILGGFQRSDLIVIGARPSMGKTSLVLNMAQSIVAGYQKGHPNTGPVAIFSLEMSGKQLGTRLVARAANVSSQQVSSGSLSDAEFQRVALALNELANMPLYIDETAALTLTGLRARARNLKRKHGIGLIIVDYLQLMSSPIKGDHSRVQEISMISKGLKHLARELDVPVIAVSQLSRSVESRDNKRPQLSDLRESGSIEQDADVVLMLYRNDYYLSRALGTGDEAATDADRRKLADMKDQLERCRGITELLVSKNRKGPTDTVKLFFDERTTTFRNYAPFGQQ